MQRCTGCGRVIEEGEKYCSKCGHPTDRQSEERETQKTQQVDVVKCICGTEMNPLGTHSFKPEWAFFDAMTFDLYVCPKCRRIEWFVPAQKIPAEIDMEHTPKSFLKKCARCGQNIPIASEECQYCGAPQKPSKR